MIKQYMKREKKKFDPNSIKNFLNMSLEEQKEIKEAKDHYLNLNFVSIKGMKKPIDYWNNKSRTEKMYIENLDNELQYKAVER